MAPSGVMKGSTTKQIFINFLFGLLFGTVFTHILMRFSDDGAAGNGFFAGVDSIYDQTVKFDAHDPHGAHIEVNDRNKVSQEELSRFSAHKHDVLLGENALNSRMFDQVRVLCWVMTNPANIQSKAAHVKATWAGRCNKVLFVSSQFTDFPTIAVVDHEGREYLWQKTRGAFQYIYDHHLQDADWFLKADDDTYVIVENMRKLVSQYEPSQPIYFGRKFKPYVAQGYMSGGAGYILSREAVKLLVEKGFQDPKLCRQGTYVGGAEDVEIGRCLMNVGVKAGDSRTGVRETFHPFVPQQMIVPNILPKKFWYWSYNFYEAKEGPECCSDYSVSFHYVAPNMMYQLEYMVYHLRPFGVGYYTCPADIRSIIGLPADVPQALQGPSNPEKKQAAAEQPEQAEPDPGKQESAKQEEHPKEGVASGPEAAKKEPPAGAEQKDGGGEKQEEKPKV